MINKTCMSFYVIEKLQCFYLARLKGSSELLASYNIHPRPYVLFKLFKNLLGPECMNIIGFIGLARCEEEV